MSTPAAVRVYLRDWTIFKRVTTSVGLAAIVQPLMFLLGVGLGVGELVDSSGRAGDALGGQSYFAFYSTAMLATTAMFVLTQECLWPTLDGFQWSNANYAMISTPITPTDVLLGKVLHYLVRATITVTGCALVLQLFADTRTWRIIPGIAAGVLCAMAFALPISAFTASQETDAKFPMVMRFGVQPMFLFGGAFYPIEQLPDWLEPIAWITPLWHGVELCRGAVLGGLSAGMTAVHVSALVAFIAVGFVWARRTFTARLLR